MHSCPSACSMFATEFVSVSGVDEDSSPQPTRLMAKQSPKNWLNRRSVFRMVSLTVFVLLADSP